MRSSFNLQHDALIFGRKRGNRRSMSTESYLRDGDAITTTERKVILASNNLKMVDMYGQVH